MMNPLDALVLARTKLRSHPIRTGFTVVMAGLLFGLLVAALFFIEGVFTSIDRYSDLGLNSRTLLSVGYSPRYSSFDIYSHMDDEEFVGEVEAAYKAIVATKQAASKKYSVPYDPAVEDPSPISIDPITKRKVLGRDSLGSEPVQRAARVRDEAKAKPFSIDEYLSPYRSAIRRGTTNRVEPTQGSLTYMKEGKENQQVSSDYREDYMISSSSGASLTLLDASVSTPFIADKAFDPSRGEVPVIVPFSDAEKLLGLDKLPRDASPNERQERLRYVRSNVGKVTAAFCYRSNASRTLMGQAVAQQKLLKYLAPGEAAPALLYNVPDAADCSGVTVKSDTRTAAEKQADDNRVLFEKEVGTWVGEPTQHKVVVRGVGISGDLSTDAIAASPATLVTGLLNSSLGYETWSVPLDLFEQLPEVSRPAEVFDSTFTGGLPSRFDPFRFESYLVEFTDKAEARALLDRTSFFSGGGGGEVMAYPFGSGTLFVDELRTWVERILFWALIVVGAIAAFTLWSVIGRTIADSRRESAVFRAIGATRLDIASIYGLYAFLLSLRVVVFALLLGLGAALTVDVLFSEGTTVAAQLAYAAVDTSIRFRLIDVFSWQVLLVLGVIVAVGLLASVVPILLGIRRNPIADMRDDS